MEKARAAGKIESVDFQEVGGGIDEGETGEVVVDDGLERSDDTAEQHGKFASRNENVVYLEKDLEAIALAGELRLVGLRGFRIERVIDGYCDLAADALHELKLRICDALGNEAAKTHGTEAALGGGERDHGQGTNADFAEALKEIGEASVFFRVGDNKRLLRLPNPAGRMAFDGRFAAGFDGSGETGFENVEAHNVAYGVVKDKREEIKFDDAVKTLGEVVKKSGEIAVLGDGFGHFEQGFELTPGVFKGRCGG